MMIYFPEIKYLQVIGICIRHTRCVISNRGGNYFLTVGAKWYTQPYDARLSLCQMLDPAAVRWIGVVQALIPSMAVAPLLTIPGELRRGRVWCEATVPLPHHCAFIATARSRHQTMYRPFDRHRLSLCLGICIYIYLEDKRRDKAD
jgi:hypothetical protein